MSSMLPNDNPGGNTFGQEPIPVFYAPTSGYQPQQPHQQPATPQHPYTPWSTRVVAFVIDQLPVTVFLVIAFAILTVAIGSVASSESTCRRQLSCPGYSTSSELVLYGTAALFGMVLPFSFSVWNYGQRQGMTGQSIGKKAMKFQVVSEKTGEPIGFGMSLMRQIVHVVDGLVCYLGYLFPLWDAKRQTFADKIMSTVCVPVNPAPVAGPYPGWSG
ncbi:hypothetical protein BTO20_08165 [Mycobacterium dioxanotrophicus]|uniref:RDD domain-containing protein n=1 Tax=Mycobacterium dioxanotrophicus TaxID=482462 RepID=A0A1Y0C081_9MYCO|nr:RDD family protein [Mycobacterium dioxanotrophicus]ART68552.1 hypothetical protein BTO20_08165 [Mycobacterium dioxanotrophicus]